MSSETVASGYRCPICDRGRLLLVRPDVWHCERPRCNNEFFHDTDGSLNVRDKVIVRANLFQRERMPTVAEIVEVIRTMPYHVERCVHVHRDRPNEPLDEVFIDVLSVWVDFDGRRYSADRGRGFATPRGFQAWRLRRAISHWRKENNV